MSERRKYGYPTPNLNQTVALTSYPGRILVMLMLVVSPWMLGSVAGWAQFGLAVGAVSALGLWFLEIAITRPKMVVLPLSVLPILLGIGLGVLQIWPLPTELKERLAANRSQQQWEQLAAPTEMDREIVGQMEVHLGPVGSTYQWPDRLPISIDPQATRLMTVQLLFAAIAYVLGAYYFHQAKSLFWLCLVLAINGLVLATFGIVQKLTGPENSVFMGSLQVDGAVFGPYVNRNNAAGWLIMSMSAAVMLVMAAFLGNSEKPEADDDEWMVHDQHRSDWWYNLLRLVHELNAKKLVAVFALVLIVGGVLATLSRGGTLGMILGSVIGFLVIGVSSSSRSRRGIQYMAVSVVLGLLLVGWLGFGQKLMDRFEQADKTSILEDARVQTWTDTWPLFSQQWLLGSGLNTYQHVHRPWRTTIEQKTYVFAENQYFQTMIDAGLVGIILLVVMLVWSLYQVSFLVRRARHSAMSSAGVLGSVALGSQAVTACFDFGLYLPANTMTFAVLMGAMAGQAQHYARRDSEAAGFAVWGWGRFAPVLVLALLGTGLVGALQFYRLGQMEDALFLAKAVREKEQAASPEDSEEAFSRLSVLANLGLEANLHDALGQQWVLNYRRSELERLLTRFSSPPNERQLAELWASTSPAWRASRIRQMQMVNPAAATALQQEFLGTAEQRTSLLNAYGSFLMSRRSNPFRPELHLRLAELGRLMTVASPIPHLDRPIEIAPRNPQYQWIVGLQKLEACGFDSKSEFFEPALGHLQAALAMDPNNLRNMEPLLLKKSILGVAVDGLSAELYAERLLVGYPDLLLDFVDRNREIRNQPEVRQRLLLATKSQLDARRLAFNYSAPETWAMGRIEMELGNWQAAKEQFDMLLQLNYSHVNGRYQRVLARIELGELAKAEEEIRALLSSYPNNSAYVEALRRIQSARAEAP